MPIEGAIPISIFQLYFQVRGVIVKQASSFSGNSVQLPTRASVFEKVYLDACARCFSKRVSAVLLSRAFQTGFCNSPTHVLRVSTSLLHELQRESHVKRICELGDGFYFENPFFLTGNGVEVLPLSRIYLQYVAVFKIQ